MRYDNLICDTLFILYWFTVHLVFLLVDFSVNKSEKRGGNGSELAANLNHGSHAYEVMKTRTVRALAIMNINRQRTSNGYEEEDNEASISRKNLFLPSQIALWTGWLRMDVTIHAKRRQWKTALMHYYLGFWLNHTKFAYFIDLCMLTSLSSPHTLQSTWLILRRTQLK